MHGAFVALGAGCSLWELKDVSGASHWEQAWGCLCSIPHIKRHHILSSHAILKAVRCLGPRLHAQDLEGRCAKSTPCWFLHQCICTTEKLPKAREPRLNEPMCCMEIVVASKGNACMASSMCGHGPLRILPVLTVGLQFWLKPMGWALHVAGHELEHAAQTIHIGEPGVRFIGPWKCTSPGLGPSACVPRPFVHYFFLGLIERPAPARNLCAWTDGAAF